MSGIKYAGCLGQRIYEGTICSQELRQWQMCFSGQQTNDVYVPSSIDQDEAESMASQLLTVLPLLSPTPECVDAIKPFMCLYLFGLCDAKNRLHQVSRAECVRLRDDVCAGPWKIVSDVQAGALPDCSTFEDQEIQCLGIKLCAIGSQLIEFTPYERFQMLIGRYLQMALMILHCRVHRP